MLTARVFSSARARFAATAATVFALVALGGVTAAPAYAYGDLTITISDASTGGAYGDQLFTLAPVGGGMANTYATFPDGSLSIGDLDEGDYYVNPVDSAYVPENTLITIGAGGNFPTVSFDKYKVDGYVPTGMGSGNTTAYLQKDDGAGGWTSDSVTQTVSAADDSFLLRVPSGPGTYRIVFVPSDASNYFTTYSTSFVVDGIAAITPLGLVPFDEAATLSGNVKAWATNTALPGATVYAQVAGVTVAQADTDISGNFRIKVPHADAQYTLYAEAPAYLRQYFDHISDQNPEYAAVVGINATDGWDRIGFDFQLSEDTGDLTINTVANSAAYEVSYTIYQYSDYFSTWSTWPIYQSYQPESSLSYRDMTIGDYRIVASHPETGVVLTLNGACYLDFSSSSMSTSTFTDVVVDPTVAPEVCSDPAWAAPGDAELTGTVENIDDFDYAVIAQLWGNGPYGQLRPYDSSTVDPTTGEYTLTGIRDSDFYFLKFVTDDRDPYLDTYLGGAGYTTWAADSSTQADVWANHQIYVDLGDPDTLQDYDVTLGGAVILPGSVLSGTTAVVGDVQAIDASDDSIRYYEDLDADGNYLFKLPIGGDYVLYAEADDDAYIAEYWDDEQLRADAVEIDASDPGAFGPFDFDLEPAAAQLWVWVSDEQTYDEVIVHLYYLDGGAWTELEEQETTWQESYFNQNFDTGVYDGLTPGDYRVRFESAITPGLWLEATEYAIGQDADEGSYSEFTTPSCYVDFLGLTDGFASFVDATFDVTIQDPAACGPEPLPEGDVSGHFEGSATYGSEDVANHEIDFYNDDIDFYGDTDEFGDFVLEGVPNGTYTVNVYPTSHTPGTHDYTYYGPDVVLTGGDIDLGTLSSTRYGNAFGEISNWDNGTMAGATATVMHLVTDADGDQWVPGPLDVPISATGEFEVPGIDVDGSYGVLIRFPDTWAPVYITGGLLEPTIPFAGYAEEDYDFGSVTVDLQEFVPITGTVFFGSTPAEGTMVIATPIGSCGCTLFSTLVDENGDYSLDVAPGVSYEVVAFSAITQVQVWEGLNYPLDYTGTYTPTPVAVGTTGATEINFSLIANDEVTFSVSPYTWDAVDGYNTLTGVDVHLYQKVGSGWVEVGSEVANPWSILEGEGDGEYRLRFSKNGDWLAISEMDSYANYPFADEVEDGAILDPAQCFYDFDELEHGTYVEAYATLYEDSSAYDCGPELAVYDVTGSTVQTSNAGGGAIEGQTVTLTNTITLEAYSTTTDSNGVFTFENVPVANYAFEALSMVTANGHAYVAAGGPVTVDGAQDLGAIELTRYGNVEVQILNYNATAMAHTTAKVQHLVGGVWEDVILGQSVEVDSSGFVELPGVVANGTYSVYLNYPAGFVDGLLAGYDEGVVLTGTGYPEYDLTGLDTLAYTTISGTVRLGATWVSGASILAENPGGDEFTTTSAVNGSYTVAVPAGDEYSVEATKTGLLRGLVTDQDVFFAPVANVNLEMLFAQFEFDLYTWFGIPISSTTVTAHLYRQVAGGWQELQTDTASTVHFWTTLSGSYRLRFSDGADWLAVSAYDWYNSNGSDYVAPNYPDPDVCFIDIAPAQGGGDYSGEVVTDPASAVDCGAEPAVIAPPVTPGTSGSGTKKPVVTTTEEEVVVVEPTSTPTPTPSASETETDAPDDATGVDKPATASAPDFTWAFWVAGILVLLVLAGGAVYFVRRRP